MLNSQLKKGNNKKKKKKFKNLYCPIRILKYVAKFKKTRLSNRNSGHFHFPNSQGYNFLLILPLSSISLKIY